MFVEAFSFIIFWYWSRRFFDDGCPSFSSSKCFFGCREELLVLESSSSSLVVKLDVSISGTSFFDLSEAECSASAFEEGEFLPWLFLDRCSLEIWGNIEWVSSAGRWFRKTETRCWAHLGIKRNAGLDSASVGWVGATSFAAAYLGVERGADRHTKYAWYAHKVLIERNKSSRFQHWILFSLR